MEKKCETCNITINKYDACYFRYKLKLPLYYCTINCYYGIKDSTYFNQNNNLVEDDDALSD
jgi:hypothetical protein